MSTDSNSADSFEDFKSDELNEAYDRKNGDQEKDESSSYRTVTSGTTSYKTCPEAGGSDATSLISQSMSSIAETLKYEDDIVEQEEEAIGSEGRFDSSSTWQDLEREALSVWVDDQQQQDDDGEQKLDKRLVKAIKMRDLNKLKEIGSRKSGFICDRIRRMVWPIITETDVIETAIRPTQEEIESHPFYQQVCLDVNRSLKRFPPSVAENQRSSLQDELVILIMRILIHNPSFFYYQGYHDICITYLLILGQEVSFHVVDRISQSHLKEFMQQSMERTSVLLEMIPLLLQQEDPELAAFIENSGVGTIFALSWVITWFSHVLRSYDTVGRLFDYFMCSDPVAPIYLSACLLMYKSDQILKLDCDMASVHSYLCRFLESEEEDIPFDRLMLDANSLMHKHPSEDMVRQAEKRHQRKQEALAAARRRPGKSFSLLSMILSLMMKRKVLTLSLLVLISATVYQYFLDPDFAFRYF
jgi:hypothetical protein